MTLTIELDAETEARLTAEATQRGVSPEQYAGDLLRSYMPHIPTGTGVLKPGDIAEMTRLPVTVTLSTVLVVCWAKATVGRAARATPQASQCLIFKAMISP